MYTHYSPFGSDYWDINTVRTGGGMCSVTFCDCSAWRGAEEEYAKLCEDENPMSLYNASNKSKTPGVNIHLGLATGTLKSDGTPVQEEEKAASGFALKHFSKEIAAAARRAHNPDVVGSIPTPATNQGERNVSRG